MRDPLHKLWALLVASLLAMAVGLGGLVAFVSDASTRLERGERDIVEDTAPSILAVQEATVSLSETEMLLRDRLRATSVKQTDPQAIAERKQAFDTSVETYLSLPVDPGEEVAHRDIHRARERFERSLALVLALPPTASTDRRDTVRAGLDRATHELERALLRASTINADIELRDTTMLASVRRTLLPLAVTLELGCLVAAAVALFAAYRVVRSATETAEEARRTLEQRATSLDGFSARVAHDLLAPLQGVGLALALGRRRLSGAEDESLRTTFGRAEATLGRVRQMCADLLEFARAGAMPVRAEAAPVEVLAGVVQDLQPMADEAGVELTLQTETERHVRCAAGVLSSVAANLVRNAIQHGASGGTGRVVVHTTDDGPNVRVDVADSGPGIAEHERAVVFEPYVRGTTARAGGLGLGLATVRRLVEAVGGHVGVSSEPGYETHFWLTLPAVTEA